MVTSTYTLAKLSHVSCSYQDNMSEISVLGCLIMSGKLCYRLKSVHNDGDMQGSEGAVTGQV